MSLQLPPQAPNRFCFSSLLSQNWTQSEPTVNGGDAARPAAAAVSCLHSPPKPSSERASLEATFCTHFARTHTNTHTHAHTHTQTHGRQACAELEFSHNSYALDTLTRIWFSFES